MNLESSDNTVLGKDEYDRVRVKFLLSTIPTHQWTAAFNRYNKYIRSIKNSKSIIIQAPISKINTVDLYGVVVDYIQKTDQEIASENSKINTLKSSLASGYVIVHDGLSYVAAPGGKSPYQQYLEDVQERRIVV